MIYDNTSEMLQTIAERALILFDYHQKSNNDSFLNQELQSIIDMHFDIHMLCKKIPMQEDV